MAEPESPMTAKDVCDALVLKWPDADFLHIYEAPETSSRSGRKIDVLVMSLWQSRGFERHAVEIKVSAHDWRRELMNVSKADFWWHHAHRFWLAVPESLVATVQPDLPDQWGLLSCTREKVRDIVNAPKHQALDFSWNTTIGLIRAAADSGAGALQRAESRGFERGVQYGEERERKRRYPNDLNSKLEKVREFEEAAGISVLDDWRPGGELGEAFRFALSYRSPRHLAIRMDETAKRLSKLQTELLAASQELRTINHASTEGEPHAT